ncbi:similar to Saccharomyces cerevisiae YBR095C RXT2 Subunit of the histone deacetylase Rpd3L complex [Maudiozyma barnettii]|uniref:Similar to Saccharomyces cerevisiae YBR095C RXT2 Subunit of the histone deacetylase Rpd3L complex n=1 Tax=Maudiozyma barnettii TaxID=61262 RepID=A0A8H2VJQ1_9SACH|nr:Rxt2p [Kazachstania barnettii]CAB4256636.1 similar to Saccharomyces cerevisiae YBR095C RXT2 Subunit of the histone deacetylase Rpd3L complex [Kazachstania barnettii]CAD1785239.1 similar to Saccharomyces cerevisiae YBR095C RXT2 Subunit of the histone deacetylase Rpd3L complex [Kazachstania barnettii]
MTTDNVTELSPSEEQAYIRRFAQRIIKERSGNYRPLKRSNDGRLVYPDAAGVVSNRGNKLLQGSEIVTRANLNPHSVKEDVVYYNGSEHKLLQRMHKRMKFFPEEKSSKNGLGDEDEDEVEEIDLNDLVNVREILTPIASLSDISNRPTVARTFNNSILQNLSQQTVLMVEKEQNSIIRYNRILEVFLGDFPEPLYEKNLKLKKYNHNLTLPDEEEDGETNNQGSRSTTPPITSGTNPDADTTDNTIDNEQSDKTAEDENNDKSDDKDHDHEQDSSNGSGEMDHDNDPFFALPEVKDVDGLNILLKDLESSEAIEQMETTRQMAQIALQRNQEFIRNLKTIRNYMDKACRIRERILAWSKEYSGVQEDGVTVPNALRVVKRGLISATTNRSVGKNEEEEGADEAGADNE